MTVKRRTYIVHVLCKEDQSSKEIITNIAEGAHDGDFGIAVCLTEAVHGGTFKQKADIVDLKMDKPE